MKSGTWLLTALLVTACDDGDGQGTGPDAHPMDASAVDGQVADGRVVDASLDRDRGVADSAVADGAVPDAEVDATQGDATSPDAAVLEGTIYRPCAPGTRVGGFIAALQDGYTAVQGQVMNSASPAQVLVVVATEGTCTLYQPPSFFCDPGCAVGSTCGANGCVPLPTALGVGEVSVVGLAAPVAMNAVAPVYFYTHRGDLAHPGFAEGDAIVLTATGLEPVSGFRLSGQGVAPLVVEGDSVPMVTGMATGLRWTPPVAGTASRVRVDLNIANHGGTPGFIDCAVPDTGAFDVPVALTNRLLAFGASGFPRVVLTRETVDSAATAVGCVDFRVQSAAVLDVDIAGLTSCSLDGDCPAGQTCQPDLTCGGS